MDASTRTPETPLGAVPGADVTGLSDHELVEVMMAARRLASRAQAAELAAVAELTRRRTAEEDASAVQVISPRDYLNDEVAAALTLTPASADDLIRCATGLIGRLPATFAALAAGDLDYPKARTLWHGTAGVSAQIAAAIETKVLARAPGQTTGEIRAKVRRLVKRLDPHALTRRRRDAERRRALTLTETDEDTAHLTGADLPADAAGAAYGRVAAIAAGLKRDGDGRGIDQLRADVFLALLRGTLRTSEPPADPSRRPLPGPATQPGPGWSGGDDAIADVIAQATRTHITALTSQRPDRHRQAGVLITEAGTRITNALADLRTPWCLSDHNAPHPGPPEHKDPGHGDLGHKDLGHKDPGHGPPEHKDLEHKDLGHGDLGHGDLGHGDLGHGDLGHKDLGRGDFGHGGPGYRVPAAMRRLIEHRDRRCCFPGCRRPVRYCDADHSTPFHQGGATCPCNVAMLCRRHHRVKQTPGWRLQHLWPGVILWVGPTGHWRISAPADRE